MLQIDLHVGGICVDSAQVQKPKVQRGQRSRPYSSVSCLQAGVTSPWAETQLGAGKTWNVSLTFGQFSPQFVHDAHKNKKQWRWQNPKDTDEGAERSVEHRKYETFCHSLFFMDKQSSGACCQAAHMRSVLLWLCFAANKLLQSSNAIKLRQPFRWPISTRSPRSASQQRDCCVPNVQTNWPAGKRPPCFRTTPPIDSGLKGSWAADCWKNSENCRDFVFLCAYYLAKNFGEVLNCN